MSGGDDIPWSKHEMREVLKWYAANVEHDNRTSGFTDMRVREVFRSYFLIYVIVCALVALAGVLVNTHLLVSIKRKDLKLQPLFAYVINMAVANILLAGVVFPATTANLLLSSWHVGELACIVFPMFQVLPVNVVTLTFVVAAEHYYRIALQPLKSAPNKGEVQY